jgi:hypothetical protein
VVEVLEPFEVGDGDTASVEVEIGNDELLVGDEDFVAAGSDGTVGAFGQDLGFDFVRVVAGNDLKNMFSKRKSNKLNLFFGANAENIAFSFDKRTFSFGIPNSSAIKTDDGTAVLQFVVFEGEDINSVLVKKIAVVFRNTDAFGSLEESYVRE